MRAVTRASDSSSGHLRAARKASVSSGTQCISSGGHALEVSGVGHSDVERMWPDSGLGLKAKLLQKRFKWSPLRSEAANAFHGEGTDWRSSASGIPLHPHPHPPNPQRHAAGRASTVNPTPYPYPPHASHAAERARRLTPQPHTLGRAPTGGLRSRTFRCRANVAHIRQSRPWLEGKSP